jgi:predicted TIM-barrel fold metal-dependent hydrolase
MTVIDGHFHIWPDAIARRALANPSPEQQRFGDGTAAGAIEAMDRAGIDRAVCLGVANTGRHVESANSFVASLDPARFVGFGTIHPDLSVEDNVASLRAHHIRGVKIHPLFQNFSLDDPRLWEILDALQGEFAAIIHVGEGGAKFAGEQCTPRMLRDLAHRFPRLALVACHFGGYHLLDHAEESVVGLPGRVHLDTSWPPSLATVDPKRVRAIINRHGPDRVVFGSDWPMADPAAEVATIESLGLSDEHTRAILGENLARIIG